MEKKQIVSGLDCESLIRRNQELKSLVSLVEKTISSYQAEMGQIDYLLIETEEDYIHLALYVGRANDMQLNMIMENLIIAEDDIFFKSFNKKTRIDLNQYLLIFPIKELKKTAFTMDIIGNSLINPGEIDEVYKIVKVFLEKQGVRDFKVWEVDYHDQNGSDE